MRKSFVVTEEHDGARVDVYLATQLPEVSRSHIQKLISMGKAAVDGHVLKRPSARVHSGQEVTLEILPPEPFHLEPQPMPLDIIYEDRQLIVINKPRGVVVHPGAGRRGGTLVNALLAHCRDLSGIGGELRPGIVHRLDKDTTGLLVAAKTDTSYRSLVAQIRARTVVRQYLALVRGSPDAQKGVIEAPIGRHRIHRKLMTVELSGKPALTEFEVLERFKGYSLVRVALRTGRTHQIRVHMAYIGHPVAGDPVYGKRPGELGLGGQALHAEVLGLCHPESGRYMEFRAEPPDDMKRVIDSLRKEG